MPGITYPYNLCGIKVPGYTTSSTEAEGETLLRYLVTRGVLSSNSNDSNLAFKKQTYKGCHDIPVDTDASYSLKKNFLALPSLFSDHMRTQDHF